MNNIRQDGFDNQRIVLIPHNLIEELQYVPILKNTSITDIGYFPKALNHYIERSNGLKEYVLIFCLNGEGFVCIDNIRYELSENRLIIVPPHTKHSYGSESYSDPWDILWIHFTGNYVDYYYNHLFTNTPTMHISLDSKIKLSNIFFEAISTLEFGTIKNNLVHATQCINYFLSSLSHQNVNNYKQYSSNINHIDKSISYMLENINSLLTLDDIASNISISKSHISFLFKEETGYSPIDFFITLKMQKACSLLKYSDMSIKNISTKYGYTDAYYFSRLFKKFIGVSPKLYRINSRNK